MSANDRQVGGEHYKTGGEEHWDRVARLNLDYFQGQITKYVERWKKKNGVQDLEKARHFLDKYIELAKETQREAEALARKNLSDETLRQVSRNVLIQSTPKTNTTPITDYGPMWPHYAWRCPNCTVPVRTNNSDDVNERHTQICPNCATITLPPIKPYCATHSLEPVPETYVGTQVNIRS